MKKSRLRFVVASCAVTMLPVGAQPELAQAQDAQRQEQAQQRDQDQPRGQARQRGQGQQPDQTQQRGQIQQRGQAQQIAQRGESSLEDYMVKKLMMANQAEIELSQMAMEKAQHEDVKKFAQKLVKDHQQQLQELQQLQSGGQSGQRSQPGQPDSSSQGQRQPGQSQPEQIGQSQPGQSEQTRPDQPRASELNLQRTGQERTGQERIAQATNAQPSTGESSEVPQQLTQVTKQTAEKTLQMAKEMLQEAGQGKEFDMTFVGMQVVSHAHMVAELDAMRGVGSQQFQQLVSKAEKVTRSHLEEAKSLAKKLREGDQASSSSSQPRRTQQPNAQQ